MKKYITDINNKLYFIEEEFKLSNKNIENNVINVYKDRFINKWYGLGAALTEASAYNYSLLDNNKKNKLINDIYSNDGLNYNYARLPIGSNDFSLDSYSYSYKKDLSDFSIERDKRYIIPLLKDIYSKKKLTLISSPWSPPAFMKNNKVLRFGGKLKKKYYDLYATYLNKYIDFYNKEGFIINYITIQNEPFASQKWESCKFSLDEQKNFINNYLLEKLYNLNTNLILWDHNREDILNVYDKLYIDNNKVKAFGLHWYSGGYYNNIKLLHEKNPSLLLINTEMCCGYSKYDEMKWVNDAKLYLKDIISCMNNGLNAYLEWNLLLDYEGGPHHVNNPVKSSIILNEEKNDYIKTPIYHYLRHISCYENYEIIENDNSNNKLYIVSAKKDNDLLITILNDSDEDIDYSILVDKKYLNDTIKANSIITYKKNC